MIYFRSERKYFNSLTSTSAVIDILEEKYGICYDSPNIGKRYQTEKALYEAIASWPTLNPNFDDGGEWGLLLGQTKLVDTSQADWYKIGTLSIEAIEIRYHYIIAQTENIQK